MAGYRWKPKCDTGVSVRIYSVCNTLNGVTFPSPILETAIEIRSFGKDPFAVRSYAQGICDAIVEQLGEAKFHVESSPLPKRGFVSSIIATIRKCNARGG